MSNVVITFAGEAKQGGYGDLFPFKPCLLARQGDHDILRAWVHLDGMIGEITAQQLDALGYAEPHELIKNAMLLYGQRRLEPLIRDIIANGIGSGVESPTWLLGRDDRPQLLALATSKTCEYQSTQRRDLFCTIPAAGDPTAVDTVDGRSAAPTSRWVCNRCNLPDTDYLCSHLLHPAIRGGQEPPEGAYTRWIVQAICDRGRAEVEEPTYCRLGGHSCCQRILELSAPPATSLLSVLGVPESFDVLDAHWRLAFGKKKRLLSLSTLTGPSTLVLGCASRAEFESRLSALADVIDRLKIDDDLLPDSLAEDKKKGSLNRLEACLTHKLPPEQHQVIKNATQTLRRVHRARSAGQHGLAQGGLTESLADLGIIDAPPNWQTAWDTIRAATIDALTILRQELRRWIDAQDV